MAGVSYGNKGGRIRVQTLPEKGEKTRSAEEVVREIKASQQATAGEYRERSLALHGLVCALCGREFDSANRHLLTVHHKDGNHHNNPPDGSNWENLCVYCHEEIHSREVLGDYMNGTAAAREEAVVYRDQTAAQGMGALAQKLKMALEKKDFPK